MASLWAEGDVESSWAGANEGLQGEEEAPRTTPFTRL